MFEDEAVAAVQEATGTLVVTIGDGQLVVTQPLADVAGEATQLAAGAFVALLPPVLLQLVVVQLLIALATAAVQVCTATFAALLPPVVLQLVVTQLLAEVALETLQNCTGTLLVLLVLQSVRV